MVVELQNKKQKSTSSVSSPAFNGKVVEFGTARKKQAEKKALASIMNRANRLNW
ncbi:hypothetical protein [Shewanella atlantica]|uniref:hypothetical protein n=1 Tax=Shewanella atlantica TaxID=271099 RepID=UPI00163994B5|nr:hypothetical protein [Shewanella atlantica]